MKKKFIGVGLLLGLFVGLYFVLSAGGQATPAKATSLGAHQTTVKSNPRKQSQTSVAASSAASDTPGTSSLVQGATSVNKKSDTKVETYVTLNEKQYPLRTYKALAAPNDPLASQWWVTNTRADQSWDIPSGPKQTTLAIIDTGFALKHEEFANRWYVNAGESGVAAQEAASTLNCADRGLALSASCNLIDDDHDGIVDEESGTASYQNPSRLNCTALGRQLDKSCNRIDDDSNGYIDDVSGWDFMNFDNLPQAGELNPAGGGTQHGTWVTGLAAGTGNNGKGVAGVDWNTKVLPIQALDDDSNGDTRSVGRAIYYAVGQHVDVISLSLGSDQPDDFVRGAVQAALKQGIVVVAAAGNDACDCMVYPANYPEVISVGALNNSNQLASFSSFGQNLDILAPGTNLTSANWQSTNQTSAYSSGLNGTSFAAPLVSGMLSRLKSWQPTATPLQLTAALTENTNRLSLPVNTPHDLHYGFGTLDIARASQRLATPKTDFSYTFGPVSRGGSLNAASPVEPLGNTFTYACENGVVGSTAIYEEIKNTATFFTVSKIENQQAVDAGYSSGLFMYACVRQPNDGPNVMHNLDVFKEFRNDYRKLP